MKRLAFFEIPVLDMRRAVKFYEEVLQVKLPVMECETEKMAFFPEEDGQCPGALSQAADFPPSGYGVLISLQVGHMDEALAAITREGGKIIRPKTKIEAEGRGYFALFTDSEGNRIGLYSDQ